MLRYILKRIALFLPIILIISIIVFGLTKMTPGDPVLNCCFTMDEACDEEYPIIANLLHLDKPAFYCNFLSQAYPDTLYRILKPTDRLVREKMVSQYGNWPEISAYFEALAFLKIALNSTPDSLDGAAVAKIEIKKFWRLLNTAHNHAYISMSHTAIERQIVQAPEVEAFLSAPFLKVKDRYGKIRSTATRWKLFVPGFHFYGFDNQYHIWITNFFGLNENLGFTKNFPFISWQSNLGFSCTPSMGRVPVIERIRPALKYTLILSLSSIFIIFLVAIPLGVYTAERKGSRFDRWSSLLLFMLYSMPNFWIATIMIVFFTTAEYGEWTNIFPSIGLEKPSQYILPIFCLSLGSLAFISRQMRGSMIAINQEDFIRTARAKGLSKGIVAWRHAFRNALFPIITILASVFPVAIAGSIVIEVIFNIPGMGRLVYFAIREMDWPVVYAVLMLSAFLTMFGMLFSDLLYAKLDPRVVFDKKT